MSTGPSRPSSSGGGGDRPGGPGGHGDGGSEGSEPRPTTWDRHENHDLARRFSRAVGMAQAPEP
eukprot:3833207-Lingulodinium_polyedra.AAC.1